MDIRSQFPTGRFYGQNEITSGLPINREPLPNPSRMVHLRTDWKECNLLFGGLDRNARPESSNSSRLARRPMVSMQHREIAMTSGSRVISWFATILLVVGCATTTPVATAATTET